MSARSDSAIRNKLRDIVPEYSPQDGNGTGCFSVKLTAKPASPGILRATTALR
jgi:hypothetical protein